MPRSARVTRVGSPHHVVQRGNRRSQVFFSNGDYLAYLHWLREYSDKFSVKVLAYCLMTNHVHLVVMPQVAGALSRMFGSLHSRIAQRVNRQNDWRGHLWQGRYFSSVLDEMYFWAAIRYVERNPVSAGMTERAEDYAWSSAAAHCGLLQDPVLSADHPWLEQFQAIGNWSGWLAAAENSHDLAILRSNTARNLPCGSDGFVRALEAAAGRKLSPRAQGRPGKKGTVTLFAAQKR